MKDKYNLGPLRPFSVLFWIIFCFPPLLCLYVCLYFGIYTASKRKEEKLRNRIFGPGDQKEIPDGHYWVRVRWAHNNLEEQLLGQWNGQCWFFIGDSVDSTPNEFWEVEILQTIDKPRGTLNARK